MMPDVSLASVPLVIMWCMMPDVSLAVSLYHDTDVSLASVPLVPCPHFSVCL